MTNQGKSRFALKSKKPRKHEVYWRWEAELNRCKRICSPLPNRSAIPPVKCAHYSKMCARSSIRQTSPHRFQFGGMLSTLSPSCLRNGNDFRPLTGQLTNSQQSGATPRTMCKGLGNGMESGRRPPETLRHKVKPTHPHGPDRLNWEIAETDDMRRDPDDRSPS